MKRQIMISTVVLGLVRLVWGADVPTEVNGRKIDAVHEKEGIYLVQHPVAAQDRPGRPLYVVLHSAGHDALRALACTRDEHNHDIYRAPDDFYALYVDCFENRAHDWWWGFEKSKSFELSACEKRVMATIERVIRQYGIDRDRVYLSGNSMGGSGTLGIGLRHGDVFAALKANVPAGVDHAAARTGFAPYPLPTDAHLPDPPPFVDYSAPNDKWALGHERLFAAAQARKWQGFFFWGAFGHANNDPVMLRENDLIHAFDWLAVRRCDPYPAFTQASTDNPCPWPDNLETKTPGQVNGFFRWSAATATVDRVEMDLFLASDATLKSRIFSVPASARADVTLRRIGAFKVAAGDTIDWTFGAQRGTCVVRDDGLVTARGLDIHQQPARLVVRRAKKPKYVAHRGEEGLAPEGTLDAGAIRPKE